MNQLLLCVTACKRMLISNFDLHFHVMNEHKQLQEATILIFVKYR